ncbi:MULTISPECIES: hypothetical protein [Flavobacteriaceae]|jgi:hypothetical protein|uniref:Uncharacterized protein n=1 Tax=Flagellimonas nanhaiensis TaxID=2292706 RepID=A0A371JMM3_9FLAO|nr:MULTISPECIES: hypothetical protein [Flavobacteriaceae]NNM19217.1 hypothetical protein [Croceitalea sp.]RDY58390.1 hypothetical protein DX873_15415 [Allomuricauda nanhaiensis]
MIYLNFTNLDEETQQHLMTVSKKDIEQKFGLDLQRYAKRNNVDYQSLLEQEAQRNLYTYDYVFII